MLVMRQRSANLEITKNMIDVAPFGVDSVGLFRANLVPLCPVGGGLLAISARARRSSQRLPQLLPRIRIRGPLEPARLMRRQLARFAHPPSLALEILELLLQLVGLVELAALKRTQVWAESTVGWREPRSQLVRTRVERDGKRCQVERRCGLFRVALVEEDRNGAVSSLTLLSERQGSSS